MTSLNIQQANAIKAVGSLIVTVKHYGSGDDPITQAVLARATWSMQALQKHYAGDPLNDTDMDHLMKQSRAFITDVIDPMEAGIITHDAGMLTVLTAFRDEVRDIVEEYYAN